jgi:hypothetical protein
MIQEKKTFRLGDIATMDFPEGDGILRITAIEQVWNKDGKPQVKFTGADVGGTLGGKTSSWWYTLDGFSLQLLGRAMVRMGIDENLEFDEDSLIDVLQTCVGMGIEVTVKKSQGSKGDREFTNVYVEGRVDLDAQGRPIGGRAPAGSFPKAASTPTNAPAKSAPSPFPTTAAPTAEKRESTVPVALPEVVAAASALFK